MCTLLGLKSVCVSLEASSVGFSVNLKLLRTLSVCGEDQTLGPIEIVSPLDDKPHLPSVFL